MTPITSNYLQITGWHNSEGLGLIQNIEAHNGGRISRIFCNEMASLKIFDNAITFCSRQIVVREDIINKIRKDLNIPYNLIFISCTTDMAMDYNYTDHTFGIILI
jgi:hypothetical protein